MISDKESAILSHLHNTGVPLSQRYLAKKTGISVGLVNALLKKFIQTGYVKAKAVNKRQLQYLLTPLGMATIAKRSYNYMTKTIHDYRYLQGSILAIVNALHQEGCRHFVIYGDGALKDLLLISLQNDDRLDLLQDILHLPADKPAAILNVTNEPFEHPNCKVVNILERIAWPDHGNGNGGAVHSS